MPGFLVDSRIGGTTEDIKAVRQGLKGLNAYVLAIVQGAAELFELAAAKAELGRPVIWITIPAPSPFGPYYDASPTIVPDKDPEDPEKKQTMDWLRPGKLGGIFINESIVETLLYAGRTRERYFQSILQDEEFPSSLPKEISSEIKRLYDFWDNWRPGLRLDLSTAYGIPQIAPNATVDELIPRLGEYDETAFWLMVVLIAHEYNHLINQNSSEDRKLLLASADLVLGIVPDFARSGDPEFVHYLDLLKKNPQVEESWVNETSADIGAVLSFIQKHDEVRPWLMGFSALCLVQCLVEGYLVSRKRHSDHSHPVSFIRVLAIHKYVDTLLESGVAKPSTENVAVLGVNAFDSLRKIRASTTSVRGFIRKFFS
jgi:hypothetical protein